ncbi:hypothetical protein A2U01_0064753, partial [Trifolium medium]|nr:hypothetical protein [Trifolium medium]
MVFDFQNIGDDKVINNADISLQEYKKANVKELLTNCSNYTQASKAMFGLVVCGGMEWNGK